MEDLFAGPTQEELKERREQYLNSPECIAKLKEAAEWAKRAEIDARRREQEAAELKEFVVHPSVVGRVDKLMEMYNGSIRRSR